MKLRLSYTLLDFWRRGRVDDAINYYLGLKEIVSKEIEFGKEKHKENEDVVKTLNKLSKEFGGLKLKNPKSELKIQIEYNELWDLVGVIDVYDEGVIYELKTGKIPSVSYLSSSQLSIYTLLCQSQKLPVEKIYVIHYDGVNTDWAMKWFYPEMIEEAKDFVDGLGYEIYKFFKEKKII